MMVGSIQGKKIGGSFFFFFFYKTESNLKLKTKRRALPLVFNETCLRKRLPTKYTLYIYISWYISSIKNKIKNKIKIHDSEFHTSGLQVSLFSTHLDKVRHVEFWLVWGLRAWNSLVMSFYSVLYLIFYTWNTLWYCSAFFCIEHSKNFMD